MTKTFLTVLFILCIALPAKADVPVGDWYVQGKNANDTRTYKGYVSVIKSDQTYTVLWRFGSTTYIGTGIDLNNYFAVTFKPSDSMHVGLLLMRKKEDKWQGKWTQMGAKQVGQESWVPHVKAQ